MSDQASAYPDNLMNYANKSKPNNTDLESVGADISRKLAAFLKTNPDPKVLPAVRDIGKELTAYASEKQNIDQWVFDVGMAFLSASTAAHPSGPNSYYADTNLGSQLSVTTNSTVTKDLTNNAITQQAKSNADKLKKLLDNSNPESVNENRDQIEQAARWLQFYKDDPVQAAAFFNELGPEKTLALTNAMQFLHMDDQLPNLSQSLATASQSDTFDPHFAVNLADAARQPNPGFEQQDQRAQLALLFKNGVYSQDFLTKFGDEYLYRQGPVAGALQFDYADPVVGPFFNALSRNPEAAYSYLTGPSPMPNMPHWVVMGHQGNPTGTSRLAQLETFMSTYSQGGEGWPRPDWVNGLNQSVLAADRQASDFGGPQQVSTLLHDLSDADLNMVNDGYRPVIQQLVSEHIDTFVPNVGPYDPPPKVDSDWTWQERLFKGAVADGDGHVDVEGVRRIQDAVYQWVLTQKQPLDDDPSSGTSQDKLRALMYKIGVLWGLTSLPIKQSNFDAAHLKDEQAEAFSEIMGLIPIKVPGLDKIGDEGLKQLAEYLSDQAIDHAKDYAEGKFKPSDDLSAETVNIYYQQLARMRLMLTQQFIAQHPEVVKGMSETQIQQYITDLAKGGDPSHGSNPEVADFRGQLDSASTLFHDQFSNPGTGD